MNVLIRIIGFLILIPIWYYAGNPIIPNEDNLFLIKDITLRGSLIVAALGLSYYLLHRKYYPVQFVVTVIIVDYIAYKLNIKNYFRAGEVVYTINLYVGILLVVTGTYTVKLFTFILTPIQNLLSNLRINISMPILAAILFVFPVVLVAPETIKWWEDYQLYQRNPEMFNNKVPKLFK